MMTLPRFSLNVELGFKSSSLTWKQRNSSTIFQRHKICMNIFDTKTLTCLIPRNNFKKKKKPCVVPPNYLLSKKPINLGHLEWMMTDMFHTINAQKVKNQS